MGLVNTADRVIRLVARDQKNPAVVTETLVSIAESRGRSNQKYQQTDCMYEATSQRALCSWRAIALALTFSLMNLRHGSRFHEQLPQTKNGQC